MKNLRRTSSWSHRSLLILWNLYKSKSEPLAFLSINHWVSWNDLVEISIMWSHFVWRSCCETWDKENRSWVGRRTTRKTWKGKMRGSKISEGFYWAYPSWLVLWVIPNSWDLIRLRHSVPVHETKNKNPSAGVISPNNSIDCRLVVFLFPSWDFLFQPYPAGPTRPTRLSSIHKICHSSRPQHETIENGMFSSHLNWKTSHGDENHPALTQYFLCIGFHVIPSSFLTQWHFCLKIAPNISIKLLLWIHHLRFIKKCPLSIWAGKNPSFRISIWWIYILIYANLQVLTGSHHISSSLHSSAFDVLREFGVSHGHEVASWKKNWVLRLGEGLSCCCHVENCGSK